MGELVFKTASALAAAIRAREVSAVDVVDAHLAQIERHNPRINALVTVDEDGARRRAIAADKALESGVCWGPLHGVPVTIKDALATAGLRTTCGHRPLADYVPREDATVVARLRDAGAIVLGKTNLPELAMDIQSENPLFGATSNPWGADRTAGGSSGGEAAALASGMSALGVGSDIGGSIRVPAHFCGVFGLKPTEGRVPRTGHIPPLPGALNPVRHLSVCGPMARAVEDLRLGLTVMAGPDGRDLDVPPAPLEPAASRPLAGCRFAWTDSLGALPSSSDTRAAMSRLTERLTAAGCEVERACPPGLDVELAWRTYGELLGAMVFAELPALPRALIKLFGRFKFKDVLGRAMASRATGGARRYFELLERRDRLVRALEDFLARYDAWLCPVSSTPAFRHRAMGDIQAPIEIDGEPWSGNLAGIGFTCVFNLTGSPVVTCPIGRSADGLPIGVQVVGRRWGELALLEVASALTRASGAFRRPPGF